MSTRYVGDNTMKLTPGDTSHSCSCTSCFYKADSEKPSRRLKLRHGSKLDRYYLDNNIPVREQKLFNKLVRTRAVYDDIRKQLLSDTNVSAELTRGKRGNKDLKSDMSNDILHLINIVDKGEAGQASLSECCSCCSCDSDFRLKGHKVIHSHRPEFNNSGTSMDSSRRFKQVTGPRPYMYDEHEIPGHRKHRGDRRIGKRVRNKAKLIQSDPCSCILESIGLLEPLPKQSTTNQVLQRVPLIRVSQTKEPSKDRKLRRAYHKMESGMGEAIRKSGSKIMETKRQLGAGVNKSLENLKKAENKIKKTVQKAKAKYGGNLEAAELLELYENTFGVTLPSEEFLLDDEDKEMEKIMKKWLCDFECDPEECAPTECLEMKKRSLRVRRKKKDPTHDSEIEGNRIKKTAVTADTKIPETASEDKNNSKAASDEQQRMYVQKGGKGKSFQINIKGKGKKSGEVHSREIRSRVAIKVKTSKSISSLPFKSSGEEKSPLTSSKQGLKSKNNKDQQQETKVSPPKGTKQQIRHTAIQLPAAEKIHERSVKNDQVAEFHKKTPDMARGERHKVRHQNQNDVPAQKKTRHKTSSTNQMGGYDLKRCVCTLKLKSFTKPKVNKAYLDKAKKPKAKNSQTMNLDINAPPPYTHTAKKQRSHSAITKPQNRNRRSQSTPSLTSRTVSIGGSEELASYVPKAVENKYGIHREPIKKFVKENSPGQSVVRYGSTISFNIEFYKGTPHNRELRATELRNYLCNKDTIRLQKKAKGDNTTKQYNRAIRQPRVHLIHISSQNNSSGISKHTLTKHYLQRTLKHAKQGDIKIIDHQGRTSSKSTLASGQSLPIVKANVTAVDKGTLKKDNNRFPMKLLPYECEPGVCIPGKCNPHECLKLINARNIKRRAKSTETANRLTKSSNSITRRPFTNSKITEARSVLMAPRKSLGNEYIIAKQPNIPFSSTDKPKQSGIGSSIRLDVKFYKMNYMPKNITLSRDEERREMINKTERSPRKNLRDRGSQRKFDDIKHQSTAQVVEKRNKGVFINSAMKRCFCSLKLHSFIKNKRPRQVATASTKTTVIDERTFPKPEMATKGTKMERKPNNIQKLQPYECEPYYCIPGECNPYQCMERIKIREKSKSKEFGMKTTKSNMNSKSSATTSFIRNVYIQSNLRDDLIHRKKILKHSRYCLSNDNYKSSRPKVALRTSSRSAVRIGSNISLNIEIYKTNFMQNDFESALQQKMTRKDLPPYLTSKVLKNKDVSTSRLSLRGRESQSKKGIKWNKSKGIRPKLKRCFCTLKLQNKLKDRNHKNMYIKPIQATVMPAQVFYNNAKIIKYKANNTLEYKIGNSSSLVCPSTSQSFKQHKLPLCKGVNKISTSGIQLNHTHLMSINPFIKRSFYAMNLQVDRQRQKRGYKLEPYECEPGVCVPDQCNPIECQKRILGRLVRKASTMTSTERASRSMSTETAKLYPDLRSRQLEFRHNMPTVSYEPRGFTHDTSPKPQGDGVRVGSRISFNIEFYKNDNNGQVTKKSTTATNDYHHKRSDSIASSTSTRKHSRTTGTRGYRAGHHERDSQSITRRHHKGSSSITSKHKRCFCTLKLQKKGRQQTADYFEMSPETATIGQNTTDKFKLNYINNLEPHECEPYVCVPGECDPLECLERIKRRNKRLHNKGYGTGYSRYRTASTMTANMNIPTRGKYVQFNKKPPQICGAEKNINKSDSPEGNVVRVGSNISFKIEFYKDNGPENDLLPQKIYNDQTRSNVYTQDNGSNKRTESKRVEMDVFHQNRESQVDSILKKHRTRRVGPMLKRCFCTLALHKQTAQEMRPRYNEPKMVTYGTQSPNFRITPDLKDASQNYGKGYKIAPYECEPGVCTPGQCDPYVCAKLIKKRQVREFGTLTRRHRGRSTSTGARNYKKYIDRDVQSIQNYEIGTVEPRGRLETSISQRQLDHDKQGVRFGSNISFKLEFYKCNNEGCNFPGNKKNQEVSEYKSKRDRSITSSQMGFINRPSQAQGMFVHRPSQFERSRMSSKGTGVGPFLNRCYCTLKLQKFGRHQHHRKPRKSTRNISIITQGDYKEYDPILYKERGTKPRQMNSHLKPYECKPGTCVPGFCNPRECYESIQRRNLRTIGTGTKHYPGRHVSNNTYDREMRNSQTPKNRAILGRSTNNYSGQSQIMEDLHAPVTSSVTRIGSKISFNLEFYKNSPGNYNDTARFDNFESVGTLSATGDWPKVRARNQYSNYTGPATYHNQQQAQAYSADKSSDMGPMLKKCYCTLALQTNDFDKHLKNISTHDKSTGVHLKYKKFRQALEPYECEPGVCIPGHCDPYQCLDRIKRRGRRTSRVGTQRNYSRSRSTATGFDSQLTPKTRSRLIQSYGPMVGLPRRTVGEEPRLSLGSRNEQGKRIGSNISLNIEFFKENVFPNDVNRHNNDENVNNDYYKINDVSPKGQSPKLTNTHQLTRDSAMMAKQKTESRASAAGKALKRCFCTATLLSAEKRMRKKQVVTVGRVDKIISLTPFKPNQNCVPCQVGTKMKTTGFNVNKKYIQKNNVQQTSTIPQNMKETDISRIGLSNNEVCKCLRNLSFLTKKISPEENDPSAYTTVQISGDDMTKNVSVLYDRDPGKETTVVMIGGADVDYKINQGNKTTTRHTKQKTTKKRLNSYVHTKQNTIDESNKHQIMKNNVVNNGTHMKGFQIKILAHNKRDQSLKNKFGNQDAGESITNDLTSDKNISTLYGRNLSNIKHYEDTVEDAKNNKKTGQQTKQNKTFLKTDIDTHNYTEPQYDRSRSYCAQICDKKYRNVKDTVKSIKNKKITNKQIKKEKIRNLDHNNTHSRAVAASQNNTKQQTNINSKKYTKQQINIDSNYNKHHKLVNNKFSKKYTVVKISGDELTKNISEVYERQKKTTVLLVGGADVDCKISQDGNDITIPKKLNKSTKKPDYHSNTKWKTKDTIENLNQNKSKKKTSINVNTKRTHTFHTVKNPIQPKELNGQWNRIIEKFGVLSSVLNYIKYIKSIMSGNVTVNNIKQKESKLQSKKTQKSMPDRFHMLKEEKINANEPNQSSLKKIKSAGPSCKHNEVYVKTNICSLNYANLQKIKNNGDIKNSFQNNAYQTQQNKHITPRDVLDGNFKKDEPRKRLTKSKAVGPKHNEVCLNYFENHTKSQKVNKNKIKNDDVTDTTVQKVQVPEHIKSSFFDNWTKKHNYTKVEISGDELIQNISEVYDPDLDMESTVLMVGGADVDCKISQCVKDTGKKKPQPPYTEVEISGGDLTQNISALYNPDLSKETAVVLVGGANLDYKVREKNKILKKPKNKTVSQSQSTHVTHTQDTYTKRKNIPNLPISGDMPYLTENKLIKRIVKKIKPVRPKNNDVYLRQNEVYIKSNICSRNFQKLENLKNKRIENKNDSINASQNNGNKNQKSLANINLMSGDMPDKRFKENEPSELIGKKIKAKSPNHNKLCLRRNICSENYTKQDNKNNYNNNNNNAVREKNIKSIAKVYKEYVKRKEIGKYPTVQISGDQLTQNISEVYDPNLAKRTTTLVVGSADVDFKLSKSIKQNNPENNHIGKKKRNCLIPDKIIPPCNCNNKENKTLPRRHNKNINICHRDSVPSKPTATIKTKICELCPNLEKPIKQSLLQRISTYCLPSSLKLKDTKTDTCKNTMVMFASPKLKISTVVVNQKDASKKKNEGDSKEDNPLTVVTISGANVSHVTRNDKSNAKSNNNNKIAGKHPCVCGSPICKKPNKTMKAKIKVKPCICGNKVCKRTVTTVTSLKDIKSRIYPELTKKQRKRAIKQKKRRDVLYKRGLNQRLKTYKKEDKTRLKDRMKRDLGMYKQVQKYRKTSDSVLLAESLFDIMKLGCTAVKDVVRSSYRTVIDPKHSYHSLKTLATDPRRACSLCKRSIRESGVRSTMQRVKMRITAMKRIKLLKKKLETNSLTNYMVHVGDDDPKKRMKHIKKKKKKKKKNRKREPMDFQCSIYMASLRKRPFLSVYYACPWFYPHCLSLLNVWRQLSDIALFLLAVAVWSPCILLMEACRALLCCTVCTG